VRCISSRTICEDNQAHIRRLHEHTVKLHRWMDRWRALTDE
jgi:hypothetical protein